jgi:DAK2 domain fusion protein YloV
MNDLEAVRRLAAAASATLEASRARIDDLNVYPVPDGDTGTNMALTMRALVGALERSDAAGRAQLAHEATRAALLGARGNSGVILSQILRGLADELVPAERLDSPALARAFRAAADAAYSGVRTPVEGTMLTVMREIAEEAERVARPDQAVADLLRALLPSAEGSLARTTRTLDVLREAGVVDAGGAGLVELLRGLAAGVSGEPLPAAPPMPELRLEAIHRELPRYRYCTSFVVEGEGLDREALERDLEAFGDSVLVVGDPAALKAHVHTDDPGAALSRGARAGVLENVEIANMHRQAAEREERLLKTVSPELLSAVVAVVDGAGNRLLFESLGVSGVVEGGQSMNPATAAIVEAVDATDAPEAIVLPNNANVVMSARQASDLASKPVHVVPTGSLQAGLAAMVAFDGTRSAEENAGPMALAAQGVATGAVTTASRDVELDGLKVRKGDYLGLLEGEPVAGGQELVDVAEAVVERLLAEPREIVTLLTGEEKPQLDGLLIRIERRFPDVELEVHEGGQRHYLLLLAAE